MDYETKPMTRKMARDIAKTFRLLLGYNEDEPFNPIRELDRLHLFIPKFSYEIVEDSDLPKNVPSVCEIDEDENFIIKIKETVYEGARKYKIGGYCMDITHEEIHVYTYLLGFKPTMQRSFKNRSIPAFKSSEWQTKAVAGEVMIPYDATKEMSINEIVEKYNVSYDAARLRRKLK